MRLWEVMCKLDCEKAAHPRNKVEGFLGLHPTFTMPKGWVCVCAWMERHVSLEHGSIPAPARHRRRKGAEIFRQSRVRHWFLLDRPKTGCIAPCRRAELHKFKLRAPSRRMPGNHLENSNHSRSPHSSRLIPPNSSQTIPTLFPRGHSSGGIWQKRISGKT